VSFSRRLMMADMPVTDGESRQRRVKIIQGRTGGSGEGMGVPCEIQGQLGICWRQ